jgi:uncharacterized protein (TIGR02598 family)
MSKDKGAFSLVEVVLAIGVISFAVLAIVGIIPIGLRTSRTSFDETRVTQIAQDIFASLNAQGRPAASPASNLNSTAVIGQVTTTATPPTSTTAVSFSYNVDLSQTNTYVFYADNDGNLTAVSNTAGLPYQITLITAPTPSGFTGTYCCQVTLRVAWQPFTQNYRDFSRFVSRF